MDARSLRDDSRASAPSRSLSSSSSSSASPSSDTIRIIKKATKPRRSRVGSVVELCGQSRSRYVVLMLVVAIAAPDWRATAGVLALAAVSLLAKWNELALRTCRRIGGSIIVLQLFFLLGLILLISVFQLRIL